MAAKIITLLHDDWEIRGNGLGNVAHLQYVPALALMRLAKDTGITLTFMAELGQQLAFRRFADRDRNLGIQATLWEECVGLIAAEGFDIQPHIHPHWFRSRYEAGFIHVDRNWNLATYEDDERRTILHESFAYLTETVQRANPAYEINTFKAGSHALQPSLNFLSDLKDEGIHVVMGPRKGMKTLNAEFAIDYRTLEEGTLPYHPDFEDVTKVGEDRGLIVLPMTYWDMDLAGKMHLIMRRLSPRLLMAGRRNRYPYHGDVPDTIRRLNPRVDQSESAFVRKLLKPYRTGLNLAGPQTFGELKHTLDAMVDRLRRTETESAPLVIESHSKDHEGNWETLRRFFAYMVERYSSIMEFMTLTQFSALLAAHPTMARSAPDWGPGRD